MDIRSEKGQQSLRLEQEMIQEIFLHFRGYTEFIQTPKESPAVCDGFINSVRKEEVIGLFESKCRNITLDQLKRYGTALITYRKIEDCQRLSKALCVPFYIFLYTSDKEILIWKVTDETGKRLFSFDVQKTRTQKTINGGVAYRSNAFLPISEAVLLNEFKL